MSKSGLVLSDNKIVLTRLFRFAEVDRSSETYNSDNPWTWKTVEKVVEYQDVIPITPDGFQVLIEWYVDHDSCSYCAWIKNNQNVFYISISRNRNSRNQPIVKKTNVRLKFLDEIQVVNKFFIKTPEEVFYIGKKLSGACALSFRQIENTYFYEDERFVYSYTETNGLAKIEIPKAQRFFIPFCWYFADREKIYHQSGWTNKMEPISGELGTIAMSNLSEVLIKNETSTSPDMQRKIFSTIDTFEKLFNHFFPTANANWNTLN